MGIGEGGIIGVEGAGMIFLLVGDGFLSLILFLLPLSLMI